MPLPTGDVIGILGDNLRLRKSVLPLPTKVATKWTEGLDLPRGGKTVLYTGLMYQLIPYIEGLVKAQIKMGDSWMGKYTSLGRKVNRYVNVSAFMARPSAEERARYDQVPINVVHLLRKAGVEFGSLYEDDLYSGALAYDLGLDEVVVEHARRVHDVFKKRGVRTVITIDPHTTTMLRSVYPKILKGYDVEVSSYLEVLAEKGFGGNGNGGKRAGGSPAEVVLHDSCVFARYEGVVDEPRELLAAAGVTVRDPEYTGRQTWCCGGPVESLYPIKAAANAANRVVQLRAAARECVTMCPMCFVNLSTAAGDTMRFKDISEYLREAYAS
ncbi:MAG: (Fe-S)-binding protein [Actinobacteria bacterium]|nr:(Fe-S)-binding protein [Actinomycetota bacterium]